MTGKTYWKSSAEARHAFIAALTQTGFNYEGRQLIAKYLFAGTDNRTAGYIRGTMTRNGLLLKDESHAFLKLWQFDLQPLAQRLAAEKELYQQQVAGIKMDQIYQLLAYGVSVAKYQEYSRDGMLTPDAVLEAVAQRRTKRLSVPRAAKKWTSAEEMLKELRIAIRDAGFSMPFAIPLVGRLFNASDLITRKRVRRQFTASGFITAANLWRLDQLRKIDLPVFVQALWAEKEKYEASAAELELSKQEILFLLGKGFALHRFKELLAVDELVTKYRIITMLKTEQTEAQFKRDIEKERKRQAAQVSKADQLINRRDNAELFTATLEALDVPCRVRSDLAITLFGRKAMKPALTRRMVAHGLMTQEEISLNRKNIVFDTQPLARRIAAEYTHFRQDGSRFTAIQIGSFLIKGYSYQAYVDLIFDYKEYGLTKTDVVTAFTLYANPAIALRKIMTARINRYLNIQLIHHQLRESLAIFRENRNQDSWIEAIINIFC